MTPTALSKFDGYRFVTFGEEKNIFSFVNDVFEDNEGKLLIAQNNGAVSVIENGKFHQVVPPNKFIINDFIRQGNGRILVTTDGLGIAEWKNNHIIQMNKSFQESVLDLLCFNDSLFLVRTATQNLTSLLNKDFQLFSNTGIYGCNTFFKDSKRRSWVGTAHGLRLLSPFQKINTSLRFQKLPPELNIPSLKNSQITAIFEDSKKNLWFGTDNGIVFVGVSGLVKNINASNGLPHLWITCIKEDQEHNIWIGTKLGLVKITTSNDISIYSHSNGLSSDEFVFVIPGRQNKIKIFATSIQELDLSSNKITNLSDINPERLYNYVSISTGKILEKVKNGYVLHNSTGQRPVSLKLPTSILLDRGIEARKGLFLLSEKNKLIITDSTGYTIDSTFLHDKIMALIRDKNGSLWAGTSDSGLYKFRISEDRKIFFQDSLVSKLNDPHIRTMYLASDGSIWIGTRYQGLIRLIENEKGYQLKNYIQKDGLSSNWVRCIAEDAKHNIWVGSLDGIDKLIPLEQDFRIFNFGKINNINLLINSITCLDDGSMIFAGFPSIIHITDNHLDTVSPFPVYLTNKRTAGNNETELFGSFSNTKAEILSYDSAQIGFEFSSPHFFNENQIYYSYRLKGSNDTNWSSPAITHSVFYASLQPGDYQFQVRTIGWNGMPGVPADYYFSVATPFLKTIWFGLLVLFFFLAAVYIFFRYRMREILKIQNMRNSIASDLHDDIGASLTNISILSSLSQKKMKAHQQADDFLSRISEESAHSAQALDDIIWNVNSKNDSLDQTIARMRRYAAELFDSSELHCELNFDSGISTERISMEKRRDLFLVYKECLNNILKHAKATNIQINLHVHGHKLVLTICDDGNGFDPNIESHRNGINNLKNRIGKHKGEIKIESGINQGTTIIASIPIG